MISTQQLFEFGGLPLLKKPNPLIKKATIKPPISPEKARLDKLRGIK